MRARFGLPAPRPALETLPKWRRRQVRPTRALSGPSRRWRPKWFCRGQTLGTRATRRSGCSQADRSRFLVPLHQAIRRCAVTPRRRLRSLICRQHRLHLLLLRPRFQAASHRSCRAAFRVACRLFSSWWILVFDSVAVPLWPFLPTLARIGRPHRRGPRIQLQRWGSMQSLRHLSVLNICLKMRVLNWPMKCLCQK